MRQPVWRCGHSVWQHGDDVDACEEFLPEPRPATSECPLLAFVKDQQLIKDFLRDNAAAVTIAQTGTGQIVLYDSLAFARWRDKHGDVLRKHPNTRMWTDIMLEGVAPVVQAMFRK